MRPFQVIWISAVTDRRYSQPKSLFHSDPFGAAQGCQQHQKIV